MVFDIQRFSIHDGPGIRTTVFLKGCNLKFFWCHNPESLSPLPQIKFIPSKCCGYGECIDACPSGAHFFDNGNKIFDRRKCISCGRCTSICSSGALATVVRLMSVETVLKEVEKDQPYYSETGVGITLSWCERL